MMIKGRRQFVEPCATCAHSRFTKSETGKTIMVCRYDFERVTFIDICPGYQRFRPIRKPKDH